MNGKENCHEDLGKWVSYYQVDQIHQSHECFFFPSISSMSPYTRSFGHEIWTMHKLRLPCSHIYIFIYFYKLIKSYYSLFNQRNSDTMSRTNSLAKYGPYVAGPRMIFISQQTQ